MGLAPCFEPHRSAFSYATTASLAFPGAKTNEDSSWRQLRRPDSSVWIPRARSCRWMQHATTLHAFKLFCLSRCTPSTSSRSITRDQNQQVGHGGECTCLSILACPEFFPRQRPLDSPHALERVARLRLTLKIDIRTQQFCLRNGRSFAFGFLRPTIFPHCPRSSLAAKKKRTLH